VYAVRYHKVDPSVILSGGWDNTVHIWDLRVGSSVRHIFGPHICGDALDTNANGAMILTASHRHETPLEVINHSLLGSNVAHNGRDICLG
jgi:COMPASS component SWD3